MPAKSKAQQRFFGMVRGVQKGEIKPSEVGDKVTKAAKSMTKKDVKDFASTKTSKLPEKVEENKKMKVLRLTESDLHNIIRNSVKSIIKEGQSDGNPIEKWIYWCFNYHDPRKWMNIFEGAPEEHFMEKFSACYDRYGSHGVMNTFYTELDGNNRQKLLDYVMNNY